MTDLNKKQVRKLLNGEAEQPVKEQPTKEQSSDKEKKRNHRGRGRTEKEKKEAYRKYIEYKKKVIELEKRNRNHLVLFPASDFDVNDKQYYVMGGNSAIIYVHEIAPKIGRKNAALRRDMDQCNDNEKFFSGVCSIQKLDKLEEALKGIGVVRESAKNALVFFKLEKEYPPEEIKGMLKLEQERLDNLNKILYSEVLYPDIHKQIIVLKKMIPPNVKNMNKNYRDIIGGEAIKSLMTMIRNYSQMAHGDLDELVAAKQMDLECDALLAIISMFSELRHWSIDTCTRTGATVVELKQLLRGKIINKKNGGREGNEAHK